MSDRKALYRLCVESLGGSFTQAVDVPGDKAQFNISKLPDPESSGRMYSVKVVTTVVTQRENPVHSEAAEAFFHTIPHKPTNIRISNPIRREIRSVKGVTLDFILLIISTLAYSWTKSLTPHVDVYKVRWKGAEADGGKAEEQTVSVNDANG